jgi:hypothetical protein
MQRRTERSMSPLPGLTRQSIIASNHILMDARVKPAHDE